MTTPHNGEQCSNFCCSDFYNMAEEEFQVPTDPLQNAIHPIFAFDKFAFPGYTSESAVEEYKILAPSLRLASKLMTTDAFMKHIVTMVDGDVFFDATNSQFFRRGRKVEKLSETFTPDACDKNILIYPRQRQVNDAMRIRARIIAHQLTHLVSMSVGDAEDSPCCAATMDPLPGNIPIYFSYGHRSLVHLKSWATHLANFTWPLHRPERELLMAQFTYATVILHETFGHALVKARFGSRVQEPFFQNCTTSEAGYELQNALFGGIVYDWYVQLHPDDQRRIPPCRKVDEQYILAMAAWPNNYLAHHYLWHHMPMGFRRQVGHFDSIVRVPEAFLSNIQSERFWTKRQLFSSRKDLEGPVVPLNGPRWIIKYCGGRRKYATRCDELPDEDLWFGEEYDKFSPPRIDWEWPSVVFVGSASSKGHPEWVGKEIEKLAARRTLRQRGLLDDHVAMAGSFVDSLEPEDVWEPEEVSESEDLRLPGLPGSF
ncbi:hypothetical protein BST61_g10289 [Cercospora zeina]